MGILDEKAANSESCRRAALRAAIDKIAKDRGLDHDAAVTVFAATIERSKYTVYGWLTAGKSGRGSQRPMPASHYHTLVNHGLIDPSLA